MVVRTYTASCQGLGVTQIEVEVDTKPGLPQFLIIGLASRAVAEAKERITSALHHCGIKLRARRTTVNLAPAAVPKQGAAFDLAIVVGLLQLYGRLSFDTSQTLFFGELALDGQVKPIPGALPLVLQAHHFGFRQVVLPQGNAQQVATLRGVTVFPIAHLRQLFQPHRHALPLTPQRYQPYQSQPWESGEMVPLDTLWLNIVGQTAAKRALQLSAAGGHHLLLEGPPGAGKSMLAQAVRSVLPPLTEKEAVAVTAVHSLIDPELPGLLTQRPFRAPQHSLSLAGLVGGGQPVRPGELSLAHHGVLFLDELREFDLELLEVLRQPLDQTEVVIALHTGHVRLPAQTTLLASSNPCRCGFFGSRVRACRCSPAVLQRYQQRLSGPLRDRFPLQLRIEPEHQLYYSGTLAGGVEPRPAEELTRLRTEINHCREVQAQRYQSLGVSTVAQLPANHLPAVLPLTPAAKRSADHLAQTKTLSSRGYWSLLQVAQTIADLGEKTEILPVHLEEAVSLRQL